MKVIPVGTSAAWPRAQGACTGWLIEEGETQLLVDCGSGIVSSLQRYISLNDLTAVIISHLHPDHFMDLFPLGYALMRMTSWQKGLPPHLFLPPGAKRSLDDISNIVHNGPFPLWSVFRWAEYEPERGLRLQDLEIAFAPTVHWIPTYAMAIQGDKRVVYSADTAPSEAVTRLAEGADLFICEATLATPEEDAPVRGHLSAREAGAMARQARAQRLLLTHIWPDVDLEQSLKGAAKAFGGEVEIAQEGRLYLP